MSNGDGLDEIEDLLVGSVLWDQLIGCAAEKREARRRCRRDGGTVEACEEEAQRAWDKCMAVQDVINRIGNILRGVTLKQALLAHTQKTMKLWSQIYNDREKAMPFSKRLAQAFKDAKIKLADDETFSCIVFVTKRPEYFSSIIPPASQNTNSPSSTRLFQILEPKIMEAVMDIVEKDRIPK